MNRRAFLAALIAAPAVRALPRMEHGPIAAPANDGCCHACGAPLGVDSIECLLPGCGKMLCHACAEAAQVIDAMVADLNPREYIQLRPHTPFGVF